MATPNTPTVSSSEGGEGAYRRSSATVAGNDQNAADEDGAQDGSPERSRKKPKLTGRPMCTNCEQCQIRKGKCDRGHPRCGWCIANDKVCEYKERKKPGLRAGYGRDLEQRLFQVEELIETHRRILESIVRRNGPLELSTDEIQNERSSGSSATRQEYLTSPLASGSVATNNHIGSETRDLTAASPALTSHGHPDRPSALSNPALGFVGSFAETHTNGNGERASAAHAEEFPPYDLLYSLVDLYFSYVNTWCPILDRRSTLNLLFGSRTLEEADRMLLHAIVTTTLRFSADPRLNEETRKEYYNRSKQKVLLYGIENSSVKALQAMVILALDLHGSSSIGSGLKMIACIARSAIQLGLATETSSPTLFPNYPSISTLRANVLPEPQDWIEDESRRRLFWMIYVLDRDATVATAFEFALDEKDIDRRLPCRDELFGKGQTISARWFGERKRNEYATNSNQHLGAFSYQVEIRGILTKIHQFLKRPMDVSALADVSAWQKMYRELDLHLRTWQLGLPPEYGNIGRLSSISTDGQRSALSPGWILLQTTYYFTLIRLHSSAAYPPHRSPIFGPSYAASQQCYSAVENIVALAQYSVSQNMLDQLGPPFAFSLWVAARVLLVHGSTIEKYVSSDIHFLVETLRKIGRFWPLALRYATILQRVIDEYQESQSTSAADGQKATPPPSVTILADMRRCAYDLDVLISNQPRHHQSLAHNLSIPRSVAPSEAECHYLEAFDFFNYPRLATPLAGPTNGLMDPGLQRFDENQFNITNFSVDVNSDWLAGNFA